MSVREKFFIRSSNAVGRKRFGALARLISSALMAVVALGQTSVIYASVEEATPAESFNFSDVSLSAGKLNAGLTQENSLGEERIPVSNSGDFTHGIQFDMPPGRAGMTPTLGISYSSARATHESPVGSGWKMGPPKISRWTADGFPELDGSTNPRAPKNAHYVDDTFSSPSGKLVLASSDEASLLTNDPAAKVFLPEIESDPVRYELDGTHDGWIEYLPNGNRRFYGSALSCTGGTTRHSARVNNELGTYSWLLLKEVDRNGNCIEYDYHHLDSTAFGASRSDMFSLQQVPVLKSIRWGGDDSGRSHIFEASVQVVSDLNDGYTDMMHGHVFLGSQVDQITVRNLRTGDTYWSYDFQYRQSKDTMNSLLRALVRSAPGENETQTTTFEYSTNASGLRFSAPLALSSQFRGVYNDLSDQMARGTNPEIADVIRWTNVHSKEWLKTPRAMRSATKFQDFNGNGLTDVVYFPAGLNNLASRVLPESTLLNTGDIWRTLYLADAAYDPLKLSRTRNSELADVDGDGDLDGIAFPVNETYLGTYDPPEYGGSTDWSGSGFWNPVAAADLESLCSASAVWEGSNCGAIDPSGPDGWFDELDTGNWTAPWFSNQAFKPQVDLSVDGVDFLGGGPPYDRITWNYDEVTDFDTYRQIVEPHEDIIEELTSEQRDPREPMTLYSYQSQMQVGDWGNDPFFCANLAEACYDFESAEVHLNDRWLDFQRRLREDRLIDSGYDQEPSTCIQEPYRVIVSTNRFQDSGNKSDFSAMLPFWPTNVRKRSGFRAGSAVVAGEEKAEYAVDIYSDFRAPLTDLNADGRADLVLLKYLNHFPERTAFAPRAYLSVKNDERSTFDLDWDRMGWAPSSGGNGSYEYRSEFTNSLCNILDSDECNACMEDIDGEITNYSGMGLTRNFNSLFLDLNADGLPDLVAAEYPRSTSSDPTAPRECEGGHRVFTNRGYRMGTTNSDQDGRGRDAFGLPVDSASMGYWGYSEALNQLRNRDGVCPATTPTDAGLIDGDPSDFLDAIPLQAIAQTDINADGRVDLIFWYRDTVDGELADDVERKIYLNNGRYFIAEGDSRWPSNVQSAKELLKPLERNFANNGLAVINPVQNELVRRQTPFADLARFVDIDDDGLQDVVKPGHCEIPIGLNGTDLRNLVRGMMEDGTGCDAPMWRRNESVLPDRLIGIESSRGNWTRQEYVTSTSSDGLAIIGTRGERLPKKAIVKRVYRGSQPVTDADGQQLSGDAAIDRLETLTSLNSSLPFSTIDLTYSNFAQDLSVGALGFENVGATIKNFYQGLKSSYAIRRQFDVYDQASSDVRYPTRGRVSLREVCPSLGSSSAECFSRKDTEYTLLSAPFGDTEHPAVRVRPQKTTYQHCENQICASNERNIAGRDSTSGYPTLIRERDLTGTGQRTREIHRSYHHDYGARKWIVGLPDLTQVYGYTEDVSGTSTALALLQDKSRVYDGRGRVTDQYSHGVTRSECEAYSPPDAHTHFKYKDSGVVGTVELTGGEEVSARTITLAYDSLELSPSSMFVDVSQYDQGVLVSKKTLSEAYTYDLRNGKVSSHTDANGNDFQTTYDSYGRTLENFGPGGAYLSATEYQDNWPRAIIQETYHGSGTIYSKTFLDGAGRKRSTVIESDGADHRRIRTGFAEFDGLGQPLKKYHPVFKGSRATGDTPYFDLDNLDLSDVNPGSDEVYDETRFDGLGRPTEHRRANGSQMLVTTIDHIGPRAVKTTDPKGYETTRYTDWQGNLVGVEHEDGWNNIWASFTYTRDGLGRIVQIDDREGNVRHLQRDLAGRVTRLDLPHQPGVSHTPDSGPSARIFDICYSPQGEILRMFTPEGNSVSIMRDELGRPYKTIADSSASTVESYATYDSSANGLGRLSWADDASGRLSYIYDSYGRPSTMEFAPSTEILNAAPNLATSYTANFTYDRQGHLGSVSIDGLGANDASLNYSRNGFGRVDNVWSNYQRTAGSSSLQQDLVEDVDYNAYGNITLADLGYNLSTEWSYREGTQRLADVEYQGIDDSYGFQSYYYDDNGNVTGEERDLSWNDGASVQITHTYDPLNRLYNTEFSAPGIDRVADFSYTAGGNIYSVDVTEGGVSKDESYSYSDPTLPQAVQGIDYVDSGDNRTVYYDGDGRVIQDDLTRQDGSSELRTLKYDAAGCLLAVNVQEDDGTQVVKDMTSENICGQDGRRVLRKTTNHLTGEVNTVIDFAGIAEIRPDEGIDADWDGDLDGIMLMRVPVGGTVRIEQARSLNGGEVIESESGHVYTDIRGSVVAKTAYANISSDGAALIQKQADYDAWGNTIEYTSHPAARHQFVDFEPDQAAGYYYMGARVYDPTLRRWLSPDPLILGLPQTTAGTGLQLNLYAYADSNPTTHIDPTGLFTAVITSYGDYGIEMGDHSAIYIERDGESYLYDPAGSFMRKRRGTSDLLNLKDYQREDGSPVTLEDYLEHLKKTSTKVNVKVYDTTENDEKQIKNSIQTKEKSGKHTKPFHCTQACRRALRESNFFKSIEEEDGLIDLPGILDDELLDLQKPTFDSVENARDTEKSRNALKHAGSGDIFGPIPDDLLR